MKIQTSILAVIVLAAFPLGAKAQDVSNYGDYKVGCESGADCNDFNVDYEGTEENSDLAQTTRTRRTRRTSSSDSKFYVGGNLGLGFLDGDADVGFGLSGLFGYNFTNQTNH